MRENRIITICCPNCGRVLAKSFRGSKSLTNCPKCKIKLSYEITEKKLIYTFGEDVKGFAMQEKV